MISSFLGKDAPRLFHDGRAKGVPENVARRAFRLLDILNAATNLRDVKFFVGRMAKQRSRGRRPARLRISLGDGWWLSFEWVGESADAVKIDSP
jgi:plasmid maintenance system killer protein